MKQKWKGLGEKGCYLFHITNTQQLPSTICAGLLPAKICGLPLWRHSPCFQVATKAYIYFCNTAFSQHWLKSIISFIQSTVCIKHSSTGRAPWELQWSIWLCLSPQTAHNKTKRTVDLLLVRDKYGWLLRLISFPLSLAEQKAGSAQQKRSWYQPLGSRGLLFWIRPLPWPESFHCCITTQMCPDRSPSKYMKNSLWELWLCMVHADIHACPKLWEDSSNDCVHAATCLLNCSPNKTLISTMWH